jgi:hypothetical protein
MPFLNLMGGGKDKIALLTKRCKAEMGQEISCHILHKNISCEGYIVSNDKDMRHGKLQSNRDFSLQGKWEPVLGCLINRCFRIKNLFDIS